MKKKSYGLIVLWMLMCCSVTSASAQVSIGIGLPNLSIGINLPLYPELVPVPGYPVYYAPRVDANYFFYDGLYWVYQNDNWYASSWYNGPWGIVDPAFVPVFILRIPVNYYRQPPVYFRGWQSNAPPRWGQHWGRGWEQRRHGWDRWNRKSAPARAPLPVYQRQYTGERYPRQVEQQHTLHNRSYRYQPRDKVVRQHFQQQRVQKAPVPAQRGKQQEPRMTPRPQDTQRSAPRQQVAPERSAPRQQVAPAPRSQPAQRDGENVQRSVPDRTPPQQRGPVIRDQRQLPGAPQHERQAPRVQGQGQKKPQDKGEPQDSDRGHGQGRDKDEERGRGRGN